VGVFKEKEEHGYDKEGEEGVESVTLMGKEEVAAETWNGKVQVEKLQESGLCQFGRTCFAFVGFQVSRKSTQG